MAENGSTIWILEKLENLNSRVKKVAATINQHVTCALRGQPWPLDKGTKTPPSIPSLDAGEAPDSTLGDQP